MTDIASEPQTSTATVSAPPEAYALILGGGTGRLYDHTHFVGSADELPLDGQPGTVYPVLWDEEKRAHLVRNVPADAAEVVAIASDMFSVTHRVWKMERHLGVASTFLLGAAKALESHSFFHDKGDLPEQLREVVRRVNIAQESFGWTMDR